MKFKTTLKDIFNFIFKCLLYIYLTISGVCIFLLYYAVYFPELFKQLLEALPK